MMPSHPACLGPTWRYLRAAMGAAAFMVADMAGYQQPRGEPFSTAITNSKTAST
jgi:hypothetical protein